MRNTDIQQMHLDEPFAEGTDPHRETETRLGLEMARSHDLERAIREDLAEEAPYGIVWWRPNCDDLTAIRILIADCLAACSSSVPHHLTTARIHWLEFLDHSDQEGSVFQQTILRRMPYRSPLDVLASERAQASADALITSLSSALDCMAGVIIGVAALPIKIKTAGFQKTRSHLREMTRSREVKSDVGSADSPAIDLDRMIEECGPSGWVDWMLHYRNMLIHRGRRLVMHNPIAESVILAPDGIPVRWNANPQLPNHPSFTEVEAFLTADSPSSLLLTERASVTLQGLSSSTTRLVDSVMSQLSEVWRSRRARPEAAPQPLGRQWKAPTDRDWSAFKGYDPGSASISPTALTFNPKFVKRLSAAALMDHQRSLWARPEMALHIPRHPGTETDREGVGE